MYFRVIFLIALILLLFPLANAEIHNCEGVWTNQACDVLKSNPNKEGFSNIPAVDGEQFVPINPMVEFDYRSVEEIYEIRQAAVAKNFNLISKQYLTSENIDSFPLPMWKTILNKISTKLKPAKQKSYLPNQNIFGQIVGGKPWWGILGISYYGPGQQGIEGLSEESRILVNPYILVGLVESTAHIVDTKKFSPKEIYPKPVSLIWQSKQNTARAQYDISSYVSLAKQYRYSGMDKLSLNLVAYNACDFGYNYLYLDPGDSRNVKTHDPSNSIVQLIQYIHLGNSCGYPGGCNNMSPYVTGLELDVLSLPARAHLKLWKNKPTNNVNPADFDFILELK